MPFILALIAIAGGAYFWLNRAKNAAHITHDLLDAANDVRLAARRFGFKRQTNRHPVDDVEDSQTAIMAIACAFLELDDLPTQDQRNALIVQAQSILDLSKTDATDLSVLGRWLAAQCQGPDQAISRISRRLYKIDGVNSVEKLMKLLQNTLSHGNTQLSTRQKEALIDVQKALHL